MVPQRHALLSVLLLALLLAGCVGPDLGRATVSLDGHELRVWVADTAEKRSTGLQAVDALADGEGMLFVYDEPQTITFGIKGVDYPIDVVFIAEDGSVSGVESLRPEEPARRVSSPSPATHAIELPAGWCEANGVGKGSILVTE